MWEQLSQGESLGSWPCNFERVPGGHTFVYLSQCVHHPTHPLFARAAFEMQIGELRLKECSGCRAIL